MAFWDAFTGGGALGGAGGVLLGGMMNLLFWFVLIIVMLIIGVGFLYIKKKRKLIYPTLIFHDLGNGKMGIQLTRAGWFKAKSYFFGLWEVGREEYLKVKDGRKVRSASSIDFHEINGRRGLVVKRKSDDNLILVPIDRMKVKNRELLMRIAGADFRDASIDIIKQTEREIKSNWEQIVQWIVFGGLVVFALIAIILITQMVQHGQAEAKDLILKAGECGVSAVQSSAP